MYTFFDIATMKEILFNPRNMAITFIAGIGLGILVELVNFII